MPREGRRLRVTGIVQGVGFRPWVHRVAARLGVDGCVSNDSGGVTIEAFGDPDALDRFEGALEADGPPAARVDDVVTTPIAPRPVAGFHIVVSTSGGERRVSIPPDLATCAACFAEVDDPADRRYGYAFTNCTDCGPRFTITRDVPYDRAQTTMAAFAMCAACRREYEDPASRRFHAEPNACPACGPRLAWVERPERSDTPVTTGNPLALAAAALRAGRIVAVKGLGGFHLACDATSPAAVARLRARKRRDEKPFAVMVRDLAEAERLATVEPAAAALLSGVERPIVLVPRRADDPDAPAHPRLAFEVAPRNPLVGLMLPYTPLHQLLLHAAGRPLVMTSGNLSEEPLAHGNAEALERLRGIADHVLLHDRDIDTPCDDSVARVVSGRPLLLRRSRGYVPRAVPLGRDVSRPVLGVGALLKNAVCLASGPAAWPGPHVGDLDSLTTLQSFERTVERLERFLQVRPEIVAHDLHPAYPSTAYAIGRAGVSAVAVQHHHAHVAAVMAEHARHDPVLGLAYDGTGLGTDGTAWGGELLLGRLDGFDRLATFRPVALAGGDTAIREVWRIAFALLLDAFDGDPPLDRLSLFDEVPGNAVTVVRQLLAENVNSPRVHGVGRYFDAFGALILGRARARHEGQVALELNGAAEMRGATPWPFDIHWDATPWQIDLRPAARALADSLVATARAGGAGTAGRAAELAGRFHATIVAASDAVVREAARRHGPLPVALTGGCFQNDILAERLTARLSSDLAVLTHAHVPPGDGGLALGQCVVADALANG